MNNRVFLFDLDATVTKEEILPALAEQVGLLEEMQENNQIEQNPGWNML